MGRDYDNVAVGGHPAPFDPADRVAELAAITQAEQELEGFALEFCAVLAALIAGLIVMALLCGGMHTMLWLEASGA